MMAGAAALFVKTTRFVENVPADIIELADKRKFPIVEVPQGLRWTRLMQDATEVIINRQASQLEQSQAIHRSLLGVVIRGGGWQELAEEASRLLERPVFVVDVSLELLAASAGLPVPAADVGGASAAPGGTVARSPSLGMAEKTVPAGRGGAAGHVRASYRGQPQAAWLPLRASPMPRSPPPWRCWSSSTRPPSPRWRWPRTGCASRPRCG